ncbi:NADH dehydrogenase (ubiquinone) 1 alpha subcomplex subunit 5, partial [Phenoliferia sp. Uapishka_3]
MSRFFRATCILRQAAPAASTAVAGVRTRTTTGLTGLAVHPTPLPSLLSLYGSTLAMVGQMPPSAVYRQSVESITKERIAAIEELGGNGAEANIQAIEEKLGVGLIEEILGMAEGELKLAAQMVEHKCWEELEVKPEPGQWQGFAVTPSTTAAEDLTN